MRKRYGKRVEENVFESLRLAGCRLTRSTELDLHHKLDFVIDGFGRRGRSEAVGVQVTLRDDPVKFKVARLRALRIVPRLFVLVIGRPGLFERPDPGAGRELKRLLHRLASGEGGSRALVVRIQDGVVITPV